MARTPASSFSTAPLLLRIALFVGAFGVLATAIVAQPEKRLRDFDQSFYTTIAYDLARYGVFSNGVFDDVDSTVAQPPPGMFFGPVYPLVIFAMMKLAPRFAEAVVCSVEANAGRRNEATCEHYSTSLRVLHALLLAIGVLSIAISADLIFRTRLIFWLAGAISAVALAMEAEIFSFAMTESTTFAIYSVFALTLVYSWTIGRIYHSILSGSLLGLLCLTRPSFLLLLPVVIGLSLLRGNWRSDDCRRRYVLGVIALTATFAAILGSWALRNAILVGKFKLTEEYGAAVLVERFAYNDMLLGEWVLAFPYCTPGIGELAFDQVYGNDSMHRFVFHTQDSFFQAGRGRRNLLLQEHRQLDPLIGGIVRNELRENWWRHLLISIPLGWCGMWVGSIMALGLVPLFGWACVLAVRRRMPLLLMYAAPAVAMLGLHALIANHYTRYNLILIGPFAVGAAWIMSGWLSLPEGRRPKGQASY